MNSQQQQHQTATAVAPAMDNAVVATAQDSQAVPQFSFDDEPLFDVEGNTALPDDFFSSPEWTDPSPALTTSMSFTLESCDTSPLLTDNYEAPELSGMPLFGDFNAHSLYSTTEESSYSPKRSPQNAFNRSKDLNEDSAMLLLRALNNQSNVNLDEKIERAQEPELLTASPSVISSSLPPPPPPRPLLSSLSSSSLSSSQSSFRGTKRRFDTSDLLPIDAPIQPRTYKTPSATSRKESTEPSYALEEAEIAAEKNPAVAKRLSNTLAARRSRHRKAEELRMLNETIEDLTSEMEMWKRRCIRAEQELHQARESA